MSNRRDRMMEEITQTIANRGGSTGDQSVLFIQINRILENWEEDIVDRLSGRIRDWEMIMDGELDGTLYTLGLRQAIDVVRGVEPDPWVVQALDTDVPEV
jgi:hypothetical protein